MRQIYLPLLVLAIVPAGADPVKDCSAAATPAAAIAIANEHLPSSDDKQRGYLHSCRGTAFENAGRLNEAAREYATARAIGESIGDRALVAEALTLSGYLRYYRGDMGDAIIDLQRSYELYTALGRDEGRRNALSNIAHVYADSKVAQYDKAIEYYRQLLAEYEAARAPTGVADTLFNLGSTYERKGDVAAALEWYRRSLEAEQKLGREEEIAHVKRSIGVALTKMNRAAEALRWLDEALAYNVAHGDVEGVAVVRQSRGIANRKLNRIDAAIADLEASRPQFERMNNMRFLEKTDEELAEAYAAAGRWRDAFRARTTHAALQRSLAEKLREETTARLRVQFDTEKKEQENRALVRIRRLQNIILALGAAVILALIVLVAKHIAAARRMRVLAMTDELTRLPNRRHLLTVADDQLASGEPFSLVVLDIDHFKRINDTWGHAAGDVVLQRVAHTCRAALRPGDAIGRTGGEEFMIVLPRANASEALSVAERMRASVEAIDCTDIDPSLRVTISLGVAERNADTTIAKIAQRADDVLYRAKESGRNRVEVAA